MLIKEINGMEHDKEHWAISTKKVKPTENFSVLKNV